MDPYFDLHRSSGGSTVMVGDWGKWKCSVFQNSSSEQITSTLQRTVLPWLLEGLKDKMAFPASDSCVSYEVKPRSNKWRMSQVVESNLAETEKRRREQQCEAHLFLWNSYSDQKRAVGSPGNVKE